MRKFRTAAVAVTSAVALTISGTAIASAQTPDQDTSSNFFDDGEGYNYGDVLSTITEGLSSGKNSSQIGTDMAADDDATGVDTAGEEKTPGTSNWAQFWRDTTLLGVIGTVIGAIIGLVNYAKFNGII